jgi:hypothetical protein
MPVPNPVIFLSYSSRDREFAERIYSGLTQSGLRLWIDRINLTAGESLITSISNAVASSQFVLAILSPDSVNSGWVQHELQLAMTVQTEGSGLLVIPLVHRPVEIPPFLRSKLYIDFSSQPFDTAFQKLLQALDKGRQDSQAPRHDGQATTFIQRLEGIPGMLEDPFLQEFKNSPIVQYFVTVQPCKSRVTEIFKNLQFRPGS